jgi:hypothetical protein
MPPPGPPPGPPCPIGPRSSSASSVVSCAELIVPALTAASSTGVAIDRSCAWIAR